MKRVDTTDERGFFIRVIVPDDYPPERYHEGIQISIDVREIFPDLPDYYNALLQKNLADRGLIEYNDFRLPGARQKIIEAIRATEAYDAAKIIEFVMEATKK